MAPGWKLDSVLGVVFLDNSRCNTSQDRRILFTAFQWNPMPARSIQSRTAQVCCAHLSLVIGLSVFELPRAPISSICLVYYLSMEYTEERGGEMSLYQVASRFFLSTMGHASKSAHSSQIQTFSFLFRTMCTLTGCNWLNSYWKGLESHDQRSHMTRTVTPLC